MTCPGCTRLLAQRLLDWNGLNGKDKGWILQYIPENKKNIGPINIYKSFAMFLYFIKLLAYIIVTTFFCVETINIIINRIIKPEKCRHFSCC